MLSGFLVQSTYKLKLVENKCTGISFIKKRLIKVYPPFLLSLVFGVIISGISEKLLGEICVLKVSVENIFFSLTMTNDFFSADKSLVHHPFGSGLWFVSSLFFLYCIYYVLIKITKKDDFLLCICILTLIFYGQYIINIRGNGFISYQMGRSITPFFVGTFVYELKEKVYGLKKIVVFSFLTLIFLSIFIIESFGLGDYEKVFRLFVNPIVLLTIIYIKPISLLFSRFSNISRKMSMAVYFTNVNVFHLMRIILKYNKVNINYNNIIFFSLSILIEFFVALIWLVFFDEKIFVKVRKFFVSPHP
ncbi:Peptidoglycan/LPS O-acetylase OafA/YrhL, contains acyltransferase and SGNH-hydrolase domains [Butyrivibrio fibrisolvens]|uniref:Peptidoglycan/LPS O-acetylase OafA/YrhL, contains acyltransferase and SGNH-hydrolase domains n=1 Tax=Butyrivibrio fibrisolvens TaxID=831 RepID=A0A1H9Q0R3_BUTFI|nr:acyltransferase family protein [Butyrivibrio fibrisolvens]SER53988.1 Peptidoglycan/LPS O-acetylase OafA/YrhL, contains acyltransferase and SGNH-hydrolase domains [Butyrivibrio fibrisolvens]